MILRRVCIGFLQTHAVDRACNNGRGTLPDRV